MFCTRRLMLVLSALLILAGGTSFVFAWLSLSGSFSMTRWYFDLAFALMMLLCVVWIGFAWRGRRTTISLIRQQLHQFEQADRIGMIMVDMDEDLTELVAEINQYLTNIEFRFEKERCEQRELLMQADVAETERHQVEAVIFSISEAVIVTNRYDELLMANQAAQDLYDFRLDLHNLSPIEQVVDDPDLLKMIKLVRQDESRALVRLLQRTHPLSGQKLDLKVTASCILDSHRRDIGAIMVVHDMTSESDLARLKDDFVSCVSHELKTPLSSIRGYAEMIAEGEADSIELCRKYCLIIQEQADRLNRLIDDVLNLSRLESGRVDLQLEPFDLSGVISDVTAALRPQAQAKSIELDVQVQSDDLILLADCDMIYQALLNLVGNALKYSPAQQKVTIRAWQDEDAQIAIEVTDQGPGIPGESLERIFEKFYRVPENNSIAGGTGLGLYLVREIIENLHQGRIDVRSQIGLGSTFTITLPLCRPSQLLGAR